MFTKFTISQRFPIQRSIYKQSALFLVKKFLCYNLNNKWYHSSAKSRIALDRSILENIFVEEVQEKSAWVPLDQLNASEQATVVSIHGEGAVRRRLMDMGVTKNVQIYVRKLAPLGDPVEITLRGYELTLRKKEASLILVEKEI